MPIIFPGQTKKLFNIICFFIFVVILLLLVSCRTPIEKQAIAEARVLAVKKDITNNESKLTDKSIAYTYAADFSLSLDKEPSKESQVAQLMTERSLMVSGPPSAREVFDFQGIIKGLLSTNESEIKTAQQNLRLKDSAIIQLQNKISGLEGKLEQKEDERREISAENAVMASRWAKLMSFIKWGVFIVIGGFVLRLIASVVPPPYNSLGFVFDYIFGGLFKLGSKVLTKSVDAAGVISKELYDVSEKTLKDVVDGVQVIRHHHNTKTIGITKDEIDRILNEVTDKEISRSKIIEIKKQLGYI